MKKIKPVGISNNLVMIQPTQHLNKIGEWVIYDVHDPAHHFTVKGTVLMVPDRLYHAGDHLREKKSLQKCELVTLHNQFLTNRSVEFDTDMELKVGDEVVFKYINHINCIDKHLFYHREGHKNPAMFMPYDSLFMAIRDGQTIMLNGKIWVEPISYKSDELEDENGIIIHREGKKQLGVGIVRNVGSICRDYLYDKIGGDVDDVKVGDKIDFLKSGGVSIEIAYHQSLNEGKHPYYMMSRREILNIH